MGIPDRVKNILRLSAEIYKRAGLPAGELVDMGADALLGGDDDDSEEKAELKWRRSMIDQWWKMYEELMDTPMRDDVKKATAMNQLRSDYTRHYTHAPKDRWVERLHADLVMAVKGDMAYTGDDA